VLEALEVAALESLLDGLLVAEDESLDAEDVALEELLPLEEADEETLEDAEELALDEDELALEDDELALEEVLDATEDEDELDEEQVGGVGVSEKTLMELTSQNLYDISKAIPSNVGIHTLR